MADNLLDHDKINFRETFNCTSGAEKWSTGWSVAKKQFCCKTSGVGCLTHKTANRSDGSSSIDGNITNTSNGIDHTNGSKANSSRTGNSSNDSSSVDGKITNTSHGISHTNGSKANSSTTGNSSNEPHTNTSNNQPVGSTPNNTAESPSDLIGNATLNATNGTICITGKPHLGGMSFAVTSPAGTPCLFGTDNRDEGWHCIMDAGKYGSLGWCWTSKSHSSWGPCSEHCPLFGQAGVLGKKIDAFGEDLRRFSKQILNKSMVEAKGHKTTNKNVTAKGHAIFGGIQRRKLHTR